MQRIRTISIFWVTINLILSFITIQSKAETPVIGFIAQDTTWTQVNSPYVTLGNIIVKEGVTLTIEPGVTVQFGSGHSLTIEGTLIARGTDKQTIKFTPKGEQKPGVWGGIVFEDSSTDAKFDDAGNYVSGSILQYCTVEFAITAVKANSASPFIDHCVISNNASRGISISKGDIVVILNSMIADNKGGGISVDSKSVTLTGNTVTGNTATGDKGKEGAGGGIYISSSGTAVINNNTLTMNEAKGGDGYYDHNMRRHYDGGNSYGGGVYVISGAVTISDNILITNTVKGGKGHKELFENTNCGHAYGGGVYVEGDVTINGNTFINNTATGGSGIGELSGHGYGGGICIVGGNATINNNTLTRNTAKGGDTEYSGHIGGDGGGGGIYIRGDNAIISNNALAGNKAIGGYSKTSGLYSEWFHGGNAYGGGVYVEGDVTINGNTFTGSTVTGGESGNAGSDGGYAYGGGIYIKGNPTIDHNTLIGNTATGGDGTGGGGYLRPTRGGNSRGGSIYVEGNSTISTNILIGNTATGGDGTGGSGDSRGGGIYIMGDTATINNNTLSKNVALRGGGIYAIGAITVNDNTIAENRISGSYGAAIYYSGSQDITRNLIANNVAEETGNTNAVYIDGIPMFTGNTIIDNQTKYNLYYARSKGSPNLNATNNYWGVTTEAEIRVKIYDFFADNRMAFVDVAPFLLENPLGNLTIVVSPKALPADGVSTATITAMLKDSKGNPVVDEALTMVVSQGTGKLSEVKNNKDGTYTATYTASRTVGSEIIWVAAPNSRLAKSVEIQLTEPGVIPPRMLRIPDTEAAASGVVNIPVEIDNITGVAMAFIRLSYDSKFLEVQKVISTDLVKGLALTTKADAGMLTISLIGAKGLAGGSGVMLQITLKIAKDAPVGETEIKLESIVLYDEAGKNIPSTGTNGKLKVKEYQPSVIEIAKVAVQATPNQLPADGKSTSTITVQVEDAQGNPVVTDVELDANGISRICWMFDSSYDDWVNTKSMGKFGHEGDDYYADDWAKKDGNTKGQIAYAGINGQVIVLPFDPDGYGNHVVIYDSSSKFALRYAHLDEILVKDGQNVIAGYTPMGKVGSTGFSTNPHLHIVLYKNVQDVKNRPITSAHVPIGEPIDPPTNFAAPFLYNPIVTLTATSGKIESPALNQGDGTYTSTYTASNTAGEVNITATTSNGKKGTVTITLTEAVITSGFTPDSDGYSFRNFSDPSLFVWDVFRDTFGKEQVEYGDTGIHKLIAEIFFVEHYLPFIGHQVLGGGVCNGMATTSLLFFENPSTLAQFSATAKITNQLEPTYELKHHIEIYQGYQLGLLIKEWKANQGKDPSTLFNIIKNSLKKSPGDQQVINIYGKYKDKMAGHSVVPYKIEEKGNNIYWVYVYDCNYPYASGKPGYVQGQENKKIVFNLDKHSWEYEFTPGVIWMGDDKNQWMNLVPLAFYHEQPILIVGLFGGITTADYGATQSVEGTAHLLFEDNEGRSLGYVNGELVSEIPGTIPIIPLAGAADVPYPETYYISKKAKLQPKILETGKGNYDFSIYTTKTLFKLDDVTTTGDSADTLEVSDDENSIKFSTTAESKRYTAVLISEQKDVARSYTISDTTISQDGEVVFQVSDGLSSFSFVNKGSEKTFDLNIEQSGTETGVFVAKGLSIGENETRKVEVQNWGKLEQVPLIIQIDKGNDGTIDDVQTVKSLPTWDVNCDGKVDISDLALVVTHFGETIIYAKIPNPDVNRDGIVDISDLVLVGRHLGE